MKLIEQFEKETNTEEPLSNGFLKIIYLQKYIEWLEKELVKKLTIPVVSNQRELLIAFSNKLCYDLGLDFDNEEEYINEFLSNL